VNNQIIQHHQLKNTNSGRDKLFWVIPLIWLLLCLAFYWEIFTMPGTYIVGGNDLNNMFRIWLDYSKSRILERQLPLWNPYLFSGFAFSSDPQPALVYPFTWFSMLFAAPKGLSYSLVLHIWLAAVGCTWWLRSCTNTQGNRLSWSSAFAGAAVYAFSGHTFARIQAGHIGVITTAAWLPWILWSLNTLSHHKSWKTVVGGAVSIGLAILAGHTATFIYVAIITGLYALMLTVNLPVAERKNYIVIALLAGLLGVMLSGLQLLPMLENIMTSTRVSNADYAFASRFSWPVGYLLTLLVPNFFGEPVTTGYWGDGVYEEMIFYVGILPLLLIWVAIRSLSTKTRHKHTVFWLVVSAIAILTAFGSHGTLHRLFYRFIPFISSMRAPGRVGFLFTCSAAFLTASAIHALQQTTSDERKFYTSYLTSSRILGVLTITTVLIILAFGVFAWGKDSNPEAGRFWHLANELAVFGLFFGMASGWILQWEKTYISVRLSAFATVIILLDLWTLGSSLVQVVPSPSSGYWNIVNRNIEPETGRVLPWGLSIFEQNGAMDYDIRSVFGYNPVEDAEYNRFITFNPDPRAMVYDLLNVAYVSATVPLAIDDTDTISLVNEDSGVFIYSRSTALSWVWIPDKVDSANIDEIIESINQPDFDPLHTAFIEPGMQCPYPQAGEVSIQPTMSPENIDATTHNASGVIVFSERYTAGWQARVDGQAVPIIKAYGILKAVCVPPGDHQIHLTYAPNSQKAGLLLTSLSVVICCILFFIRHH
jgi:hypothetical protein